MSAIIPRGVVQKVVIKPSPTTVWLKHSMALFTEDEWEWTGLKREAFIFETYEKAEEVQKLLTENGGDGWVVAMVHQETKIELPDANEVIRALPAPRKHVTSEEAFKVLEQRNLA